MTVAITRLREISRRCLAGEALDREQSAWLGSCLKAYFDRSSRTIGAAFDLVFPHGGVPWWREEAIRKRDAALRELAARFLDGHSPYAQARRIAGLVKRYAGTAWPRDRAKPRMPPYYRETPKAYIWIAFASGAAMPLSERYLRKILGN